MATKKKLVTSNNVTDEVLPKTETKFTIDELTQSKEFTRNEKDFLKAVVAQDVLYSVSEAKKLLSKILKGEVK
ncbi:MAG: hypothetical protein L0F86_02105 [Lactococcus lactis]|nr:hypothetical protein [Lactococcus lactis]MDN5473477.1 hypothetical protein [Lactococcus lactis]MDN6030168.1 hypothetical protein [Lactococcus plantarum]MDN6070609.1 hypothetical protein [Lactococcus plantarum]MDN6084370.1 hypothetical protein [Lactococcus plantarum]